MKYKIMGILSSLFVLLLVFAYPIFTSEPVARIHQHTDSEEKMDCSHDNNEFCSHLPLINIDTDGKAIPGEPIKDESGKIIGYTVTDEGENSIRGSIEIIDNYGKMNHFDDASAINSDMTIRIRGNSSREFDKKGYALRLITSSGENNAQPVMGMDAHHEWVLHGPFIDKTLIRNYM